MGQCAYRWEEWNKEKQEYMTKKCPEKTTGELQDFCIFHDPSLEKDTVLFKKRLRDKLQKGDYNFRGYYFPEDIDFSHQVFEKAAFFDGATFQNASFENAVFDVASFIKVTFNVVSFDRATIRNVSLDNAIFNICSFNNANLENASFNGSFFQDVLFNEATFRDLSFRGAVFQGAYFERARFEQEVSFISAIFQQHVSFCGASFSRTYFADTQFRCSANFEDICFHDYVAENNSQNALLEQGYRSIKNLLNLQGDYSIAGEFYYREMDTKRCRTSHLSRLWMELYRLICGYGERPARVIGTSFVIILLGAILFFFCGVERFGEDMYTIGEPSIIKCPFSISGIESASLEDFGYCVYYSVITFTTLGYGDIHPVGYSHIFAATESFAGAFFIALFVVVFARKMMR